MDWKKIEFWHLEKLILILVLCLPLLAGCQAMQSDNLPEPAQEHIYDALPETPHIDTMDIELPGTGLTAGFVVPEALRWEIIHVIQDEASGNWAVLYAVNQDDAHVIGQRIWRGSTVRIQLFDRQGGFIGQADTEYGPRTTNLESDLASPEPIVFRNHLLSFFGAPRHSGGARYIFADTQTWETTSLWTRWIAVYEDYFLARFQPHGDWSHDYLLKLFQGAQQIASIRVELPVWYQISSFGTTQERMFLALTDSRTGSMGLETVTYLLDFGSETYEVVHHHSLEDLDELVASNERWEIYNASTGRTFGNTHWGEVIARDKGTGELLVLHDRLARSAAFGPDDLLLISCRWELLLFGVNKMQLVRGIVTFTQDRPLDRVLSGVAFDSEREWFVVAWLYQGVDYMDWDGRYRLRELPYDYRTNVIISTYSTAGELLSSVDTGVEMTMFPYTCSKYSTLELEIVISGGGYTMLRKFCRWCDEKDGADFVSVRYWG